MTKIVRLIPAITRGMCLGPTRTRGTLGDSLRNRYLHHKPNLDVFQNHYLSTNLQANPFTIARKMRPQQELFKEATSHGFSLDVRRLNRLTATQATTLGRSDKSYVRLTAELARLPKGARSTALSTKRERHDRRKPGRGNSRGSEMNGKRPMSLTTLSGRFKLASRLPRRITYR